MTIAAPLSATIEGVGFWADGLPSWADALAFATTGTLPEGAPAKPSPTRACTFVYFSRLSVAAAVLPKDSTISMVYTSLHSGLSTAA